MDLVQGFSSFCFLSNLFTVIVKSRTFFFKVPGEVDCLALALAWPLALDLLELSLLDLLLRFEPELLLLLDLTLGVLLLDPLAVDRDVLLLDSLPLDRDLEFLGLGLLDPIPKAALLALDLEGDLEILLLSDTVLEKPLPRLLEESLLLSPSLSR